MERGDLVIARGFVLSVDSDGAATVAFPGGQVVRIAGDALEVRAGPVTRMDAQAYEAALRQRYAGMLGGPPPQDTRGC